ncbi:MAG TPA: hypothetical protein VG675_08600 [Bryobacteraceae bacterium]|nr:hypothetical protein [Bryobacteraceae bacterium]
MALGELTRQIAQKAIGDQVKDVLDSLRPPDLSKISEEVRASKPSGPAQGDNLAATILGQVQAMQKALKEDEELMVLVNTGAEMVRVLEFFAPSWHVLVLSGIDTDRHITRVVAPVESLQVTCKVMKVEPPAKPARVGFLTPKPKTP